MITKTDYKYFDKARQAATISDYYKTHIGCVAVYQGNIIGIGSGTTGIAALRIGRKFIGIEKEKQWFEIAENKILEYTK